MRSHFDLADTPAPCIRMIHQKVGRDIPAAENLMAAGILEETLVLHHLETRRRLRPLADMTVL